MVWVLVVGQCFSLSFGTIHLVTFLASSIFCWAPPYTCVNNVACFGFLTGSLYNQLSPLVYLLHPLILGITGAPLALHPGFVPCLSLVLLDGAYICIGYRHGSSSSWYRILYHYHYIIVSIYVIGCIYGTRLLTNLIPVQYWLVRQTLVPRKECKGFEPNRVNMNNLIKGPYKMLHKKGSYRRKLREGYVQSRLLVINCSQRYTNEQALQKVNVNYEFVVIWFSSWVWYR